MKKIATIPPKAAVLYSPRIFAGSTCRTSRELSSRLTVWNSIITGLFLRTISHLLRAPELRASRSRVRFLLCRARHNHVFGQHLQCSGSLPVLERVLDWPVFPRVVGQHYPSAA